MCWVLTEIKLLKATEATRKEMIKLGARTGRLLPLLFFFYVILIIFTWACLESQTREPLGNRCASAVITERQQTSERRKRGRRRKKRRTADRRFWHPLFRWKEGKQTVESRAGRGQRSHWSMFVSCHPSRTFKLLMFSFDSGVNIDLNVQKIVFLLPLIRFAYI